MYYTKAANQVSSYQQMSAHTQLEAASPHKIIQLLMDGFINRVATATGMVSRGDYPASGAQISLAIGIVDCLRMSLDKSIESEITTNLDDLYDYMGRRLVEANMNHNSDILEEVSSLMKTIKSGWDAIEPQQEKKEYTE